MSLADLLAVFRAHWALLAGALFFAMACAGVYLALVPSHYEATATVRLGELGRVGPELRRRSVEPDAEALARMRGPEFLAMVINALGWKDAKRVGLLTASYQVTNPEIGHLRVTVRGHSPEDASRAASAAVDAIVRVHRELLETLVARRNRKLERLESDIADSEAFLRSVEGMAQNQACLDSRLDVTNLLNVIKEEKSRLRNLHKGRLAFKEVTAADFMKPTGAVGAVSVSDQPMQPNRRRVWFFSAFVGILLGIFLVTVVAIRRLKVGVASSSADQ